MTLMPDARARAISRRTNPGWDLAHPSQNPRIKPGGRRPTMPNLSKENPEGRKVYTNLYKNNLKAYNAAKPGQGYKQQSIRTGKGFVKPDFGYGEKSGAGIPYQIQTTTQTKTETPKERSDRLKREAIERRRKDSAKKKKK
jgi:hypothetical protein